MTGLISVIIKQTGFRIFDKDMSQIKFTFKFTLI